MIFLSRFPGNILYEKLKEAREKIAKLTNLEREELEFFERDYLIESSFDTKPGETENSGFF